MDRRTYLATFVVGWSVGGSGCVGGGGDEATETATPTGASTDTGTEPADGGGSDGTESATVGVYSNYFEPVRLEVPTGTTVTWENEASGAYSTHTVTSATFHDGAADWSLDDRLSSGDSTDHTFDSSGVYEYTCTIHGESAMCGAVLVGDATLDGSLPCK